jgi:hypothetical protein
MASNNAHAQKVNETVGRIISDPEYAERLRQDGIAALKAGSGSPEWDKYFEHFAPTPGALAQMGARGSASCTCGSNTWITLSSVVTPVPTCCGATTTTTTSGS